MPDMVCAPPCAPSPPLDCAPAGTGLHGRVTCVDPKFAYNHGDYQDEIANTWLGVVGPGVERGTVDDETWTDHTNVRPTMLALLGLHDDYGHDDDKG